MTRKAGSIVINRLRNRIQLGRYFGRWHPGDRLPSVRDVAAAEEVDRKTAAAAYRRLEQEGVVRVEPRSGVYLRGEDEKDPDPLRRLHLNWLERTLASADELGLDSDTINRMFHGVSAVERRRIPVVDPDLAHAGLLARELSKRTGLECVATQPQALPAKVGPLRDPPFVIATPRGREGLKPLHHRVPIILITLATELFEEVCTAASEVAGDERVMVFVGSDTLKSELEEALGQGMAGHPGRVEVAKPTSPDDLKGRDMPGRVLIWPGAPDWVGPELGDGARPASRLVARTTVDEVRCQVARAALDHVSTSSASATRT